MREEKRNINLQFESVNYPLVIKAVEEPFFRNAAEKIRIQFDKYKNEFSGITFDNHDKEYMTMVALQFITELEKVKCQKTQEIKVLKEIDYILQSFFEEMNISPYQ